MNTLLARLQMAYENYTDVNNGYDEMFEYYVKYIEKVVPWVLTYAFMWNWSITETDQLIPEIGYGMECMFFFLGPFLTHLE